MKYHIFVLAISTCAITYAMDPAQNCDLTRAPHAQNDSVLCYFPSELYPQIFRNGNTLTIISLAKTCLYWYQKLQGGSLYALALGWDQEIQQQNQEAFFWNQLILPQPTNDATHNLAFALELQSYKSPLFPLTGLECEPELHILAGADINYPGDESMTPVMAIAARTDNSKYLSMLIAKGGDVNLPDAYGETPLHIATAKLKGSNVEILLNHHADASKKDTSGRTSLANLFYLIQNRR